MLIDALESGADTFTAEEVALASRSYSSGRDWGTRASAAPGRLAPDGAGPVDGARKVGARGQAGSAEVPELVVKADALMRGGA